MFFVNVMSSYRYVVAICDSELIGKRFESGKFQLDIKESFYKGEEVDEERAIQIIRKMAREDATFNIVGKNSVSLCLKEGIIEKEGIGKIHGIQFALVLI
jgi:hypothetical protein